MRSAAQGAVHLGEVGVESGGSGLQGDRPADQLGGSGRIAILVMQDAKQVQGVGVVGLPVEQRLIAPCRVCEAAGLV
ncbi:MAG: hypothetical protein NTY19_20685 [Planctomycetota bacterium]|nr:hypothetical protein [Planctomycetota bacterium]